MPTAAEVSYLLASLPSQPNPAILPLKNGQMNGGFQADEKKESLIITLGRTAEGEVQEKGREKDTEIQRERERERGA